MSHLSAESRSNTELASRAGILVFSRAIGALSRVGAVVVLARHLPKEDFGRISFVLL